MDENIRQEILEKRSLIPNWSIYLFLIIAIVGFGTFVFNIMGSEETAKNAWEIFFNQLSLLDRHCSGWNYFFHVFFV